MNFSTPRLETTNTVALELLAPVSISDYDFVTDNIKYTLEPLYI